MDRAELESNLQEYKAQLQQVETLLVSDAENQEYAEIYDNLSEAIKLTEELLQGADEAGPSSSAAEGSAAPAGRPGHAGPDVVVTEAPAIQLSSVLPATVAQQIRAAQQKAALAGQAPPAWAIGAACHAVSALEGDWQPAVVKGISAAGNFVVAFTGRDDLEEVEKGSVKAPPTVEEVYRGVAAPSRLRVDEAPTVTEMPKWLEIKPTDDEKTRNRKRKLQKSFKNKQRFQEMDAVTKKKQQSWLDFKTGKGAKKKTGFLSAAKKGSIFSVPDGPAGKVGVVGSGKGMTDQPNRPRYDLSLGQQ